jgi:NAD(P)-dependent dehydrogenase (short-subunit alcohol dehydrogenase family)
MKPAVLVLGATGTVGRGVVQAAVEAGWPVVAVARDSEALEQLRLQHPGGQLRTLMGSVADDTSAAALVTDLRKLNRPFLGVIAALGTGRERGRLIDQSSSRLRDSFDEAVVPHLVAARHLLPWLAESGRNCGYVVIGGPGGRYPWAGYGHRSIAAAALQMLARVLHSEARQFSVRLQLLEVESPVRTDANEKHACQQWPCVSHIGRKALALLKHRNDARCTEAVVDYRNETCTRGSESTDADPQAERHVESTPSHSSHLSEGELADTKQQEMDSDASLLPARCLQDARKLLETFTPSKNPTKKNQERTK